ncbi:MAG: FAD-binding oxidoreductase, partial [Fibrobacter sp.]|nr:FAD-binding oxidoreductase [Fibrobacter sp.]
MSTTVPAIFVVSSSRAIEFPISVTPPATSSPFEQAKNARVQPGVIGSKVNDYLRPYGRKFGPDPASIKSCMVGGIVMN